MIPEIAARVNELAPKFLDGFAPRDLAVILEAATLRRFPARSFLAIEGDRADRLFLMLEGLARTYTTTPNGEKVVLLWVPSGETAGGRAFLSKPMKYMVTTETVTDCVALVWKRTAILPLRKQYPRLIENALEDAADYVESYRDLHVAAGYDSAAQRIARVLGNLAKGIGQRSFEGTVIHIRNEELADEANVTIFTVSRQLNEWQRKGLLLKSRMRIVIRSPEELVRSVG
jgi:CRP-like cAMP-binding protein